MTLKSLLSALVFSMVLFHHAMANFDEVINIDDDSAPNSEKFEGNTPVDSSDGEGDDDHGSVMSDESGNGSSDEATTNTEEPIDGEATEDKNLNGGSFVGETATEKSTEKSPNTDEAKADKKISRVLITAAVVVGAVCIVILIAFLIYWLRKRDEGSYALSDAGYKETIQDDKGKE